MARSSAEPTRSGKRVKAGYIPWKRRSRMAGKATSRYGESAEGELLGSMVMERSLWRASAVAKLQRTGKRALHGMTKSYQID